MFPLDMLPAAVGHDRAWRFRCNTWRIFPAAVFLQKIAGPALWQGLAIQAGLGLVFHRRLPRGVRPRRASATAALEVDAREQSRNFDVIHVPSYFRVFLTFVRNSLVRDMMFPANFIIETISSIGWVMMNVGFYLLIFQLHRPHRRRAPTAARPGTSTSSSCSSPRRMFINSIVQMFFMPNADEFSELIRTGGARFRALEADRHAVSDFAAEGRLVVAGELGGRRCCCWRTRCRGSRASRRRCWQFVLYPLYVVLRRADPVQPDDRRSRRRASGSAATSRSTTSGSTSRTSPATRWRFTTARSAAGCGGRFTFLLPVLVVVNVPARMLAKPLQARVRLPGRVRASSPRRSRLAASRWVFQRALLSYRSASS